MLLHYVFIYEFVAEPAFNIPKDLLLLGGELLPFVSFYVGREHQAVPLPFGHLTWHLLLLLLVLWFGVLSCLLYLLSEPLLCCTELLPFLLEYLLADLLVLL